MSTPQVRHPRNRGAVKLEYVVVAVLIAAACVLGVLLLSRAIIYGWDVGGVSTTGRHSSAARARQGYADDVKKEAQNAGQYHDDFHK